MKKDLRLMLLLPIACVGCVVLNALDMVIGAIDTRLANSLNTPEDEL